MIATTAKENEMILNIVENEYAPLNGGVPETYAETGGVWSNCLSAGPCAIPSGSIPGRMASLVKKGLAGTTKDEGDENSAWLTEEGFKVYQAIKAVQKACLKDPDPDESPESNGQNIQDKVVEEPQKVDLIGSEKSAVDAKIAKLNKRAEKIGCPPMSLKVLEEYRVARCVSAMTGDEFWSRDLESPMCTGSYAKMYTVQLVGEPPIINGWEFLAALTHTQSGNIIRQTPVAIEQELNFAETYRNAPSACEHCNINRIRHNTFILRNVESGELKQVGSSCLVDFLGHNKPRMYFFYDTMIGEIEDMFDEERGRKHAGTYKDFDLRVEYYLYHVAHFVLEHGWTSRTAAFENPELTATADLASYNMHEEDTRKRETPSDEAIKLAKKTIAWVKTIEGDDLNNEYLSNLSVCINNEYIDYRSTGVVASAVKAYQRAVEKEVSNSKKAEEGKESDYFGEVKKREDFVLTLTGVNNWESDYGTTWFHRFIDEDGNIAVWYGSKSLSYVVPGQTYTNTVPVGTKVSVKATVKDHGEYKGTKQTVITRVKLNEVVQFSEEFLKEVAEGKDPVGDAIEAEKEITEMRQEALKEDSFQF